MQHPLMFQYRVRVSFIQKGTQGRQSLKLTVKASNAPNAQSKACSLVAAVRGSAHHADSYQLLG